MSDANRTPVVGRPMTRMGFAAMVVVCGLWAPRASAFQLKHSAQGKPVHWGSTKVTFVVDPSVDEEVAGGAEAVAKAAAAWSGVAGAPVLSTVPGPGGGQVAFDGVNTILLAREGYPPAGEALALTISMVDDQTGELLDTDVVVNGLHAFEVLAADARASDGAAIPIEGAGADVDPNAHFDFQHVVAHEIGHALGLADVQDGQAVMYAYSAPEDASGRALGTDDVSGLEALYAQSKPRHAAGCAQASVTGSRSHDGSGGAAVAFVVAASGILASRRMRAGQKYDRCGGGGGKPTCPNAP
jgi:hypothetical protein